ncbi:fructose-specific PTS transporter subunit EIIC [Staphylococcus epidermidis]|uniref:fructose-specific PTS transporter subunit EIIC n=1 Tax=Staphylococcus epidermidis TaxID=1282 RepID=UPI001E35F3D2|nr:fructose-specific PTS transporter subunit EIIC [Staphylococcus epidermidis]MCD8922970.1 fructose-specific PTS transporter subunit EIIC [Staphylococcus epidermidis]MCD9057475.1 fructose-specific PTS transporter subunit EIIC [Staphylococcus epidermidis]MEB5737344.1 fructose-specific PTS transporter subunit EIIC [Staphylococcus epidermidis]MEB7071510.1 fructose-specific PTS transporter subunit EIIC [Staphylococcus epidermidis]MEB7387376.1 fructose-specific PTS transporter subunit EIIC [Staphyl
MKILAVTSCPNGIAHTYMAQEKLEQAAKDMGVDIKVETQGGVGAENVLTSKEIKEADGIIIAADRQVDLSRFNGKPLINESVREGIHRPKELIQRVIDQDAQIYHDQNISTNMSRDQEESHKSNIQMVYQHLMNGVSFMVPFIVVGGLLIAIALTLGGHTTPKGLVIPEDSFWKSIENIGSLSFKFMVPILAGYIAVSIADKPGLVPGMIGGAIAADGSLYGSEAGAGFLGGIVAGFLAGYIAKWIKQIKVPKAMAPIMPIIIIPILSSLIVGLIFIFVIGAPISNIFGALTSWLKGMQGANIIILALIIGAMIASVIAAIGGVGDKVAHGGPIVAVLGGISNILWFFVAVVVGSLVTMFTVLLFKRHTPAIAKSNNGNDTSVETDNVFSDDQSINHTTQPSHHMVFDKSLIEITKQPMTRDQAIDRLLTKLCHRHYITNIEEVRTAILKREAESTTAIGMNVAIPHAKSHAVKRPIVAVLNHKAGVEWESLDESNPQLIFLIAVPNDNNDTHLKLLQRLSRTLMKDNTRDELIQAQSRDEIFNILKEI